MKNLNLMVFGFICLFFGQAHAQQDVFTIEGGSIPAGGTATFDIYFQDVSGTPVNTGSTNMGAFQISFNVDPGLLTAASFERAGVTSSVSVLIEDDRTDLSQNLLEWTVLFTQPPFFTLDGPSPGDLMGRLTLTTDPGASGETITLQPRTGSDFFVQDELAAVTEFYGDGTLTGSFGNISVTAGAPEIDVFSVNPETIEQGESATLAWSVNGADSVTIDQGVGTVASSGSRSVSPSETTTYTISATNGLGTTTQMVTLTVIPLDPVVINTFSVQPTTVMSGESATLAWDVANASSISIDQGIGAVAASGSTDVSPLVTTTYTLTASNSLGSQTATATLTVTLPAPVINSFEVSPTLISAGGQATLSWDVSNAEEIQIDQNIGMVGATGSQNVSPTETTTWEITATGGGETVTATATLTVETLDILSFNVNPTVILLGESTTLSWEVQGAQEITLSENANGVGSDLGAVDAAGQQVFTPTVNTTYTIVARNGDDEISLSVGVEVVADDLLRLSAENLAFGENDSETIQVMNVEDRPLDWSVFSKPAWVTVSPESGSASGSASDVVITVERSLLEPGANTGTIVFRAADRDVSLALSAGDTCIAFPLARAGEAWSTALGVINFEDTTLPYRLEVMNSDGSQAGMPLTGELAPLETLVHDVTTLSGENGWVKVTIPKIMGAKIRGYANVRSTDGEELFAYPATGLETEKIYVPHIAASSLFYTLGSLINLSAATDDFSFTAGNENFPIGSLNGGQQSIFDFRDEIMDGEVRGNGWGALKPAETATRTAAVEVFGRSEQTGLRQSVGVSLDQSTGNQLIYPHIAAQTNIFWTGVVVINPNDEPVNVQYSIFDADGNTVQAPEIETTIQPGVKKTFLVDPGTQDLGVGAAWLRIDSDMPILGYMLFGSSGGDDFFSGFQSLKKGSTRLCFPFLDESLVEGGFTGVALVNPLDETTNVDIILVNRAGTEKARKTEPLAARQKFVALARDFFSESFENGDKIIIHCETILAGFEIYGRGRTTLGGILAMDFE